ncbi:type VI secretion system-associated protein TagF [Cronobacter turicensis]|uniref:type VI secretion system-associated protein TagF n=1 Tax=Cronobacter turicensis TaxID=413502 RepID=UPI0024AEC0DC|nr:type VI secretion system-associated protein TagF [Cronobacter turicensis]MDI7403612.1 type VI secretion system-associated protein TagF [Cronobacter turicensis]
MSHYPAISWYGKLPSAGDFLQRRFPDALQRQWSHWFQVGLLNWQKEDEQRETGDRQFASAPVWNFVVPPMLGSQQVQMGCLMPGRDSVGRQYPLLATVAFSPAEWTPQHLAMAEDWYQQLGRVLHHAVRNAFSAEQLDQAVLAIPSPALPAPENRSEILDVIGYQETPVTLSWRQAAECFEPQRQTSFWWTNRSDGYPLYTHVHSGNFTGQLFSLLFDPAGGARPGRHGLYPPMFE